MTPTLYLCKEILQQISCTKIVLERCGLMKSSYDELFRKERCLQYVLNFNKVQIINYRGGVSS